MTTFTDLQHLALEIHEALAKTHAIRDNDTRMTALNAVRTRFAGTMPVHGVGVRAVVPQSRTVYRRPHYRFQYLLNGKRVTEAKAREALAG